MEAVKDLEIKVLMTAGNPFTNREGERVCGLTPELSMKVLYSCNKCEYRASQKTSLQRHKQPVL